MESPPPFCGGNADMERVGVNRMIAAKVVAIANTAIARRLDCMFCLLLFMVCARTELVRRLEFTQTLTWWQRNRGRSASLWLRRWAGRGRLGGFQLTVRRK